MELNQTATQNEYVVREGALIVSITDVSGKICTVSPEFIQASGPKLQGVFAVDGGSTALLGPALEKFGLTGKVTSGGFDLEPATLTAIKAGQLGFTIDQSP